MKRSLAIGVAAAVFGGTIGFAAVSYASPPDGGGPPALSGTALSGKALSGMTLPTLLHGESVERDPDGRTVLADEQRGTVTGRTGTTMTVRSADGTTWVWTLTGGTAIHTNGSASGIAVGDTVIVSGTRSGTVRTADRVGDPPSAPAEPEVPGIGN
jgi:hypothetical protein